MTSPTPDPDASSSQQRSSFASNTAALVGAAVFSQAVSFAATLIVTRLYGPFEVGIFGLFYASFTLAVLAASWRYEVAIVTVENDQEADDIALFIVTAGVVSAVAAALAIALIEQLPDSVGFSRPLLRALYALPISMIMASAILGGTNICARRRRFGLVAVHQTVLTAATAIAQVLMVDTDLPSSGLVAGFVVGQICGLVVFAKPLSSSLLASARRGAVLVRLRTIAGRHRSHFLYTVPYSLVTQFYYQMPILVLGAMFGTREAGFFSVAFRTTFTPITLLPTALAQVFFPEMARARDRLGQWEDRLLAFLVALGVLLAPMAAILIVFGPDIYAIILGESWREAGIFAQIIIVANLMNGLCTGYDRIYFILNHQRTALIVMCVASVLTAFAILFSGWATHTAVWLVVGWTIGNLSMAFAWMSTIYRIAGFSVSALAGRWLIVAVAVAAPTAALAAGKTCDLAWTAFVGLAATLLYALFAWRFLRPIKRLLLWRIGVP